MKFNTIQKSSTPEIIINEIMQHIKSGELKPGNKLPTERDMSQMFGVGRSSIREAIKGLVLAGYLESSQGKGTFIRKDLPVNDFTLMNLRHALAAEQIIELMELRMILECNAVKLAAERAGSKDIRRLHEVLERMQACQDDFNKFYDPDFDFHVAIAEATHNEMICETMKQIIEKSHEYYEKFMPDRLCPPEQAIITARQIVSCIEDGDAEKASRCMNEHLGLVEVELKRVVDTQS
ncbi:MAG: FadR family transcriptional regulator [Deltaproteobacteria bacterium]|jgi:GntR family transcriptional repressor for pyruvate dehydrogenase complex|nr:FadR family transcriptional regulator [Deltaproteobacteria bacterium]